MLQNRRKDAVDPNFGTSRPAFAGAGPAQTRLQHCASSSNSQANGIPLSTPTFIDDEKEFDSLDTQDLWKLLRHYGVPEHGRHYSHSTHLGEANVLTDCRLLLFVGISTFKYRAENL